jgi:hypothetical protein
MLSLVRIHTCSPWKWISVVGYWTFLFTVRLSERIVSVLWSFDCKTDWFFSVAAYLWFPWCCWWSACTSSSPSGETPAGPRSSSPSLDYCTTPPSGEWSAVGCPRNNQIFFFDTKQTETHSVSVVFSLFRETKKHFFWFVSVFRTGIETTETNRTLSKQTEKISKKRSLLGGSRNC